jgi:hypothetical protein
MEQSDLFFGRQRCSVGENVTQLLLKRATFEFGFGLQALITRSSRLRTTTCPIPVLCPFHGVKLIYIPKPIAEDVVVCPDCGTGGTFEQVVEKGQELIVRFIPRRKLQDLLKEAGYSGK